jgi:hypothetical protein
VYIILQARTKKNPLIFIRNAVFSVVKLLISFQHNVNELFKAHKNSNDDIFLLEAIFVKFEQK